MQQALELDPREAEFTDICRTYPLSEHWQRPELFLETAHVASLSIDLAGVTTRSHSGCDAFGAAAELRLVPTAQRAVSRAPRVSPIARSYYELVERTAILESIEGSRPRPAFEVYSADRQLFARVPRSVVHPIDIHPDTQRHSRSNGVAVQTDWATACRAAARELVERDRVLRSWYGATTPECFGVGHHPVATALRDTYDFSAFGFGQSDVELEFGLGSGLARDRIHVAGVFGFPRVTDAPMLFGFGTSDTVSGAIERAWSECIQRLGFLWGEEIPSDAPEMAPTAEGHQEHFLFAPHHDRLRRWLDGEHRRYAGILRQVRGDEPEIVFVDLTPSALRGQLCVVKALSAETVPLVFGVGHPWLTELPTTAIAVHPIA